MMMGDVYQARGQLTFECDIVHGCSATTNIARKGGSLNQTAMVGE